MNTKRFLLIASHPNSLTNFRWDLINKLKEKGFEVHTASPDLDDSDPNKKRLNDAGSFTHNIYMQRTGMNPKSDLKTIKNLFQLIKELQPEYVLAYTIKPVIYGMIAAFYAKAPNRIALITGLGYVFQSGENETKKVQFIKKITRSLYKLALSKSNLVFFQNSDDLELFKQLSILTPEQNSTVVNGSGVNTQTFAQVALPQVKNDAIQFLFIARLLKDKGVEEYVAAAKLIKEKYPETIFNVVGYLDSNPSSISQQQLNSWIESGTINYWGRLSDVRPAIEAAHVFVLPSYREGTPRTTLESMAMGRAIITTDAPGCRQTVEEGKNGFLVPVKSVQNLASAMEKFITTPSLIEQMGQASRKIAETKYDVEIVNQFMFDQMNIK